MGATVVFGGGPVDHGAVTRLLAHVDIDSVVAADSGLGTAMALGLDCDVVVGDMDSVDPAVLDQARRSGTEERRYPGAKDATDLELALDLATGDIVPTGSVDPAVIVVASAGGRMDHLLAVATIVGSPRYAGSRVDAYLGRARVLPVHRRREIEAPAGSTVSLLPLHGMATGVNTTGLRWPLENARLDPGRTLGVSNVMVSGTALVTVASGVVTVVLPGADRSDDQEEIQ